MPTPIQSHYHTMRFLFTACLIYTIYGLKVSEEIQPHSQVMGGYWMNFLPSTIRLNEINIPATHDTAAREGHGLVKTQRLGITNQLYMGVRMLDLRLRWNSKKGGFDLAHGTDVFQVDFHHALDNVVSFLKHADTETVMVLIWAEKYLPVKFLKFLEETQNQIAAWLMKFNDHSKATDPDVKAYKEYIAEIEHSSSGDLVMPKLGQVRGKMVIMTLFIDPDIVKRSGIAIAADANSVLAQKDWQIFSQKPQQIAAYKQKWSDIISKHMALAGKQGNTFYGLSAGVTSGLKLKLRHGPYWWAPPVNDHVANFMEDQAVKAFNSANIYVGIIAQDFLDKTSPIPQLVVLTNIDIWRKIKHENDQYALDLLKGIEGIYKLVAIKGWGDKRVVNGELIIEDPSAKVRQTLFDGIKGYVDDFEAKRLNPKEAKPIGNEKQMKQFIRNWAVDYFFDGGRGDQWARVDNQMKILQKTHPKTASWVRSIPEARDIRKDKDLNYELRFPKKLPQGQYLQFEARAADQNYLSADSHNIYGDNMDGNYEYPQERHQRNIGPSYNDYAYNENNNVQYILVLQIIILLILLGLSCCVLGRCLIYVFDKFSSVVNKAHGFETQYPYNIQNNENEI